MLSDYPLTPRLPAADMARARSWYEDTLGLTPTEEDPSGGAWYESGGSPFYLFPTPSAGTAQNTAAGWTVTGIEAIMASLRARGVVFEDYDFGPMGKTDGGLIALPWGKAAWFKDSEGNTLELSEVTAGDQGS
jgi:catechol 2,3-dioxygenase-like lactoylglutathione lyase family enzyme